jgi:hypothetical protein
MRIFFRTALLGCCLSAVAQNQTGIPDVDMSRKVSEYHEPELKDMEEMHDMPSTDEGNTQAMHSMEGRHMDMGPHMKMTTLLTAQPGDREKADQVVQAARAAAEKYRDYKVALADGYKIFLPNVSQKQYHFTNYWYAFRARKHFDPSHPTSLLYEKHGDDYKLIGVMYTARKDASEDDLTLASVGIAQWHA